MSSKARFDDSKPRSSESGIRILTDTEGPDAAQRVHTRLSVEFQVTAHEISPSGEVGPGLAATCRDISQGGFGVICRKVMYAEQLVAVVIPQKTGIPRVLFGVVRNLRYAKRGQCHLGLQMQGTPAAPAVHTWLASLGVVRKAA